VSLYPCRSSSAIDSKIKKEFNKRLYMAHEGPPGGHDYYSQFPEGYPPAGLFNVDAMTDGQIVSMGTAFDRGISREDESRAGPTEGPDTLLEHLGSDLAQLAMRDPDRGLALLGRLAQSDDASERRIALAACPPLVRLNYETGCSVFLSTSDKIRSIDSGDPDGYHDVLGAHMIMMDLLPSDLAADLDRQAYDHWPDGE
jgi:hypothetical protein